MSNSSQPKSSEKLSHEQFARQAILSLRKGKFKGIHTVFSGFNGAFRQYFGEDPVAIINNLDATGKIVMRIAKGGATIYLPEEAPRDRFNESSSATLGKILSGS